MDGLLAFLKDADFENFETILPGSGTAAPPPLPRNGTEPSILFVEDFDQKPAETPDPAEEPEIIAPVFNEADIAAAREAGRISGLAEARTEHHAVQAYYV